MVRRAPLLLALVLSACCCPEEPPPNPYMSGGPVECGRINAVELIGLREREARDYAREGGCELRVATRDGREVTGVDHSIPDPDLPLTAINVVVLDGYVHRLGR